MDIQNLVIAHHHINVVRALKDYHTRHYLWEMAKVLIPVFITGLITIIVMRNNEHRNKKRWLNDGHVKRKTELEIEIRKYILGIKANTSNGYEPLVDWNQEQDDANSGLIYDFNKSFENLLKYLQREDSEENNYYYKKIFALMDEYICYVPKINALFYEFKSLYEKVFNLKTLPDITYDNAIGEAQKCPEHFDAMVNTYLCFQVVIERILNKLSVKKLK